MLYFFFLFRSWNQAVIKKTTNSILNLYLQSNFRVSFSMVPLSQHSCLENVILPLYFSCSLYKLALSVAIMLYSGEVNWGWVLLHKPRGQALTPLLTMSNIFHLQVSSKVPLSINKSKRIWPVSVSSFPHSPATLKIVTSQDLAIPFSHIGSPKQQ